MRIEWSLVCGILLMLCVGSTEGDGCLIMIKDCCKKCNAGYRYLRSFSETCGRCVPCPPQTYLEQPSTSPTCTLCRKCEGVFQYKVTCSSTNNAICGCIKGKKCVDEKCSMCERNPCPAGHQLQGEECVECPHGTFNPGTEGTCKPWKSCSDMNAAVLVHGNSTSDVICILLVTPTKILTTSSSVVSSTTHKPKVVPVYGVGTLILIILPIVFFTSIIVITICCLSLRLENIKKNFKKIRETEQEDACSCHYPEEEHGGEEETMSPEP
ncbi:tumor necrosis factor receptor superfamily member 9 [Hyperolius riggenbachi]|uniref:tumor necrosis factor receptor superfamily member 9 n=1 Tax=Hyperolius riggenbachi TaxID=752182 RepID=UPI0035A2A407